MSDDQSDSSSRSTRGQEFASTAAERQAIHRPGPDQRPGRATPHRWGWLGPVVLGSIAVVAFVAYHFIGLDRGDEAGTGATSAAAAAPGSAEDDQAVRVEIITPKSGGMGRSTTQNGSVSAFEYSELHAKVSGYLSDLAVDIGDAVKKGQVLAEIDVPELHKAVEQAAATVDDFKAQKQQAEARLKSAQASVQTAQAQVVRARAEVARTAAQRAYRKKALDRIEQLASHNSIERKLVDEEEDHYQVALSEEQEAQAGTLAAEAQLAEAEAKVELANADLEEAAANIRVAEAELGKAQVMAEYTHVKAPYDGVITQRGYHRGDFIRSAADGIGTPLLTVARVDLMRVVVQVPERDVPYLARGNPATFRVDALDGRVFQGQIARTAQSEDTRDRTMRAEIDLPNPDAALVGGMFGYATIQLEPATNGLTIPSSCLVEHGGDGRSAVLVVRDGKARRMEIRTGRDNGIEVEVLDGLSPASQVIIKGVGAISDGTSIRVDRVPAAPPVSGATGSKEGSSPG